MPRMCTKTIGHAFCSIFRSLSAPPITISDWQPRPRNTLRGFLTAHLPSGTTLHELAIHFRDGTWSVAPMISQDGTALRGEAGKIRYAPVIVFETTAVRQRFTNVIIAALRLAHPELFAEVAP